MILGAHVSVAGGLSEAVQRASDLGCETMQIFPGSPRTWHQRPYSHEEIEVYKQAISTSKLSSVFIHGIYIVNLASTDTTLAKRSFDETLRAARLCVTIGAQGLILHPGSTHHADREKGFRRIVRAVTAIGETTGARIIFENTAGGGATVGVTLEELSELLKASRPIDTALCLDTCHLNAAGYPLQAVNDSVKLYNTIRSTVGASSIACLHCNDSLTTTGSKRDRHATLGKGTIDRKALSLFIHKFGTLPIILETPDLYEKEASVTSPITRARRYLAYR